MNILHITASPLVPNSGITVVLEGLSNGQNKLDDVTSKVLSLKDELKQIKSSYFIYKNVENVEEYLKEYRPDVAIFHSFYHIEFMAIGEMLIKRGIPFFIEPHGSFGHSAMKKSRVKKHIANHTVFRRLIKKASGYIFTNASEQEDAVYRTDNDLYIPNGVIEEVVNEASEKSVKSKMDPILYYLGRFDIHHKGLDYLFNALKILDEKKEQLEIRLYGTGSDEQIEYVNKRLKEIKNVNVNNMGTIFGDEKKKALEEANILVLTSRYEGSPMTILDAFSYGNPCLVTPGTNFADEVESNKLGWKCELDEVKIAESILRAVGDYRQKPDDYYNRTKQYVLESYTWERITEKSVKAYASVIYKTERK